MAGSEESLPPAGGGGTPQQSAPKVKTFSCKRCGASVTIRNPQSLSVVCGSCNSIIDASDENYRILEATVSKSTYTPRIELGVRGELGGYKWEVIGFLVRQEANSSFSWEEYLLFNPFHGYRWLTYSQGHWNFVTPIKEKPDTGRTALRARYQGKDFKLYDRGPATNIYVLGEFYWKVRRDYQVILEDYIFPPEMLSSECDHHEINWSLATYIDSDQVVKAFKIKEVMLVAPVGVAPNQPPRIKPLLNKTGKWWMIFVILLTGIQCFHLITTANKLASYNHFSFVPNCKSQASTSTPMFELASNQRNVRVEVNAPVDNSWFYLSGDLVNNDTGLTFPFDRSVEYYHGYDSDGSWTEGSNISKLLIPSVPAGKYYVDFDYESGNFAGYASNPSPDQTALPQLNFTLSVWSDTPIYSNYLWCLLFISIPPLIVVFMNFQEEVKRWSGSDYSPYKSSSSD